MTPPRCGWREEHEVDEPAASQPDGASGTAEGASITGPGAPTAHPRSARVTAGGAGSGRRREVTAGGAGSRRAGVVATPGRSRRLSTGAGIAPGVEAGASAMIATMDPAALVKRARREAGLSQESLAARAGVTRQAVALIECRARHPSLRMLTALLAAAGVQMRVELEPLDADVRREIEARRADPEGAKDVLQVWGSLFAIDEVVCRVEGVAAAALLGAPVSVPAIDVAFADTDATYAWLADQIRSAVKVRADGADRPIDFGLPRDARPADRERDGDLVRARIAAACPDGRFLLDAWFDTLRARMTTPEEVARHVVVATSRGPISVQPLDEIVATDGDVARVLRVMREPGAPARGAPGSARGTSWAGPPEGGTS